MPHNRHRRRYLTPYGAAYVAVGLSMLAAIAASLWGFSHV